MTDEQKRNGLHVGRLLDVPEMPLMINGKGLTAHTLIVGQSGSGKSFMLGRLLEEIIVATQGQLLILDPNSDFMALSEVNPSAWDDYKEDMQESDTCDQFTESWKGHSFSLVTSRTREGLGLSKSSASVVPPIVPWPSDVNAFELAEFLGFDVRTDAEELLAIQAALPAELENGPHSLDGFVDLLDKKARNKNDAAATKVYARAHYLLRMNVWADDRTNSIPSLVEGLVTIPLKQRVVCLDIASLEQLEERLLVTNVALEALWRAARKAWATALKEPPENDPRKPVFVVIDEAHNLAPVEGAHGLQMTVLETLRRIATEGRKYGLYLILVTQRPGRLDATVRSQCDNLCLLKMNDRHDLALIEASFGFIPEGMARRALEFKKGDLLIAGGMVQRPVYAHIGPRRSVEGGRTPRDKRWLPHLGGTG